MAPADHPSRMFPNRCPRAPIVSAQKGLTLVEILVAVLVLSVGLLGLAGLQAASLKANRQAFGRTQASVLAADMADRMRLNRQAALAGDFDHNFGDSTGTGSLAKTQVADWVGRLQDNLPQAQGRIKTNNGCNNCVLIAVKWKRRGENGNGTEDITFEYNTRI